mmetsp:Transcript_36087/g.112780  ORF Transcript_36087/g.112780 Transcript_36087/m.112780 type:complete len:83 (+) Transcript_36087:557-805(+)
MHHCFMYRKTSCTSASFAHRISCQLARHQPLLNLALSSRKEWIAFLRMSHTIYRSEQKVQGLQWCSVSDVEQGGYSDAADVN